MPIAPKYTWWEDDASVHIRLDDTPVKDRQQIFCSDSVVKVNAPPYFLLLDLFKEVDDDGSSAAFSRSSILLTLRKVWGAGAVLHGDEEGMDAFGAHVMRLHAWRCTA